MPSQKRFYHPELDCLRFCAFFAVFLHHFLPHVTSHDHSHIEAVINSMSAGVDLFFCLSSFLITALLLREWDFSGSLDVYSFWLRRILRIWPLYFAFLLIASLVVPWLLPDNRLGVKYLAAFILLGGNWACGLWGYPSSVAAPLWSVSLEEQFYLFWPMLIRLFRPQRLVPLAVGCLVIATVSRIVVVQLKMPAVMLWTNTFCRLEPIALGALFAVYVRRRTWAPRPVIRALLLAIGAALPPVLSVLLLNTPSYTSSLYYPGVAIGCVCILAAFYAEPAGIRQPTLVYLGRISYGLYVFHALAISIAFLPASGAHQTGMKVLLLGFRFAVALGLTIGLAALSYRFLEEPFLRIKRKLAVIPSDPQLAPAPVSR